ncbi:MAG TPA: hypothetical protein VF006_24410 [Longimicrobium sp.]
MPGLRIPRPFAAIAFASAVACSGNPLDLCACSQVPPSTLLYGYVTAPSGEGVEGATVHMSVGPEDCGSVGYSFHGPTEAGGRYRAPVLRDGDDPRQCIRLWALAPVGSGLRSSDTVQFTLPTPTAISSDSVRRDIALRAP